MAETQNIRPEDVVVGLLATLSKQEFERFKADPVTVHSSFYTWREKSNSSGLFDQFIFDKRDYFPYSETLDRIFDGLQLAGYLERTNPRGIYYIIEPEVQALFQSDVKARFTDPQLADLEVLAGEFVKNIATEKKRATR
ncbi:MAG: hypothetical protein ABSG60_00820 [Terracidiphilus sp.]